MIETNPGAGAGDDMTLGAPPARKARRKKEAARRGITVRRFFTEPDVHPFDELEWETRSAAITDENGKVIFEQKDVEMPASWSQLATNVVVSKYFKGPVGTPQRERSLRQLVGRVSSTISRWGVEGEYFASEDDARAFESELSYLLVNQYAAFNSPVWFNVGVEEKPQSSACFIQSVRDDMSSIMDLAKNEVMLFKYGSGTGSNLSSIRSSKEHLGGGGVASGPVSFMRGYDSFAGVIKSGGKTRRAAKMVILNTDHPDIEEFINCKAEEEKKAWALIDAGYDGGFNVPGGAYDSIQFQNANNSVRASDDFMRAVESGADWTTRYVTTGEPAETKSARDLMRQIAEAAWVCGDPGMQFDTTINDWHTCPNTAPINASNPCSEYMFLDDSACNLASLNLMNFRDDEGNFDVDAFCHAVSIFILAQEIIVEFAAYPTPAIARNSYDYRPLGLGYANLGALLMARGVPYDGPEGRAIAGAITALMTGQAYKTSAQIAAHTGPFVGFEKNREPLLRVIKKHGLAVEDIDANKCPEDLLEAARNVWADAHALASEHGVRNSQVTVLAPTGCLVGDSLVMTGRGLVRLRSLGDPNGEKWQALDTEVATDEGPRRATRFFVNGAEPVVTVETGRGYRIQGTPTHRIKVVDADGEWQWRRFADIRPGDRVPLMLGGLVGAPSEVPLPPLPEAYWTSDHTTFVPRLLTPELAEFVGYFMGDGSLHSTGLRLCVSGDDPDVAIHLATLGESLFGVKAALTERRGYTEVAFNSVRLVMWWEACGFAKESPSDGHAGKGYAPHIPDAILHSNDAAVYAAFVRGLFEADATCANGYVAWTTATERFSRDVQTLLLALGFVTTRKVDDGKSGWGTNPRFVLRLLNASVTGRFAAKVGFLSARKQATAESGEHPQAARHDHIPLTREMVDALAPANDSLRKTLLLSLSRTGTVSRRAAEELLGRMDHPKLGHLLGFFYDDVSSAELGAEQLTYDLSVPDNVTYVANGFVSHNTIAFFMDCDTTGIEPDIALVKYKKLVGGGMLKLVNQTVPEALKKLGYSAEETSAIIEYIDQNDTIEGAPGLADEHLPVFDCAFKPANGVRSIHYMGHVRMMAAAQPFISGAISKTVNMPTNATADEIANAYREAWRMGLKAIAIYRDGCKRTQPLNTSKDAEKTQALSHVGGVPLLAEARPMRHRLPDERLSYTHKFSVAGHEGYITVGMYEDGSPGEVFVTISKEGSVVSGMMDAFATAISLNLQYGVPLDVLVKKFSHMRFEPSGFTNNKQIPIAKSIVDYIFRWMALKFMPDTEQPRLPLEEPESSNKDKEPKALVNGSGKANGNGLSNTGLSSTTGKTLTMADRENLVYQTQSDAPPCPECGTIMTRSGSCYRCINCGGTSGCS